MAGRRTKREARSPWSTLTTPTVVRELFRLARWIVVGLVLYWSWCVLLDAVVRIAAQQNSWTEWGTWMVSVLMPSALYLLSVWRTRREFSRINQQRQDRLIELERRVDPERTTSGVNRDGSSDLDR